MRIGIDLGGTKTEVVALDQKGHTRLRKRLPTPRDDYQSVVQTIAQLVREAEDELGVTCSVGVGIPGTIDGDEGVVKNANLGIINGKPLKCDLSACLGRSVRIMNDATCFALSEAVDGAGAGAKIVFGVILGTGCGGGIVVNGRPLIGHNGIAGEWGHNRLSYPTSAEQPGPACYCGQRGCLETWISGTAFENDYAQHANFRRKAPEIVALAEAGDPLAEQVLQALEGRIARALSQIINIIDPAVIVLGGGLSNINRLYENVPKYWDQWIFSPSPTKTALKKNLHGDSSGVRGAAWLWPCQASGAQSTTPVLIQDEV